MIELRLLGLHALRGSDGRDLSSLPAQPKRFALLAYLAIGAGDGYHRRDTLAAMFWPEFDQFAARRALRNTLYHLREALGDDVIVTRGDEAVAIDTTRLTSDVGRIAEAFEGGRFEDVVDGYHGELLAGFHFANAGEAFEEWLSNERRRVAALVSRAVVALVEREDQGGNIVRAAYWAQRGCALAPGDEPCLRRAMELLARCGDTSGALTLHDGFVQRLATEFGAKPAAATQVLAAQIRSGSDVVQPAQSSGGQVADSPARVAPVARPASPPIGDSAARDAMPPAASIAAPSTSAAPGAPSRSPAMRRTLAVTAVVALAALVVLIARTGGVGRHRAALGRKRVLVMAFANRTGDSTLQSLGRMAQDWLTQGVVRTELVDVVDPQAVFVQSRTAAGAAVDPLTVAHRTGANLVVSGSYFRTADTLAFQAEVVDARSGKIVRAVGPVLGPLGTPVAGLDELRSRVMSALASVVDVRGTQNLGAGSELPPFDIYQDYVEGWDAYWHGDGGRAKALFLEAGHRDPAFANAGLAAAIVAANTNDCRTVDSLARTLSAVTPAIDRIGRLSLQIADTRCRGRNDEMLRLTLERADLAPGDASAQMSAAAAALWANRPARVIGLLQRVDPAVDLAWSTDSSHFAYWGALAEADHMLGRHREELVAGNRLGGSAPLGRIWIRSSAFAAMSRPTAALALLDSAFGLPVEMVSNMGLAPFTDGRPQYTMTPGWVANWLSRELAVHGDTVASRQAATRGLNWFRSRPAAERASSEERLVAAWSLEMIGDYAAADSMARDLLADDTANVDFQGELGGIAAERGDTALAGSIDRWLAVQPVARVSWSASVYRARIAALRGRSDDAMARLREAFDQGVWPRWLHQEPALVRLQRRSDFIALTSPRN